MCCHLNIKIITLDYFNGDVEKYINFLIDYLKTNISGRTSYGRAIHFQHPTNDETIKHIFSRTDSKTGKRLFDLRRAERISWIPAFLDDDVVECITCENYLSWEKINNKNNRKRRLIYCTKERFIIILEEYKNIYFLVTAYNVDKYHEHEKLIEECERYKKNGDAC